MMKDKVSRHYKVNKKMKPYIEAILRRRGIKDYTFDEDSITLNMTGNQFHKIIVRAKCELLSDEELAEGRMYYQNSEQDYLDRSEYPDVVWVLLDRA